MSAQAISAQNGVARPASVPLSAEPPKKKSRAAHLIPKLTVGDFSETSFQELIKIGRKAKARGKPREGHEARALGDLLRNVSLWAREVAPQYSMSEFIFASQALGTNRSLKPMLANLRLAEFREVNAEFEGIPCVDQPVVDQAVGSDLNFTDTGVKVMAEAPPDEMDALEWSMVPSDQWEEEDVMMDRMEMEMNTIQPKQVASHQNTAKSVAAAVQNSDEAHSAQNDERHEKSSSEIPQLQQEPDSLIESRQSHEKDEEVRKTTADVETHSQQNIHKSDGGESNIDPCSS